MSFSFVFLIVGQFARIRLHKVISVWSYDLSESRLFARARRLEFILSFKTFSVSISCTEYKLHRLWYFFIKLFLKLYLSFILFFLSLHRL